MRILQVCTARLPVHAYGGTERVVWDLCQALHCLGHEVALLSNASTRCDFASVYPLQPQATLLPQVLQAVKTHRAQVVHFHANPFACPQEAQAFPHPYVLTEHGNASPTTWYPHNTIFVSRHHAQRHQAQHFVYNGLHWPSYGPVNFHQPRLHFHFLGKAAWRVKNLQGAIDVARQAKQPLAVLGGTRLNLKRGFRLTWHPSIRFHGMVGGSEKLRLLQASRGLIFPVRWHEPFGLAIIESLYFGCPVFATPYGALPELVPPHCGVLDTRRKALAEALLRPFDPQDCHAHVQAHFTANSMSIGYEEKYLQVADHTTLHQHPPQPCEAFRDLPWD